MPDEKTLTDSGFYWREHSGTRVLICRPLEEAGFVNAFSSRQGGVSAIPENALNLAGFDEDSATNISENRRRFLRAMNKTPDETVLATAWQIHGDSIKVIRNLHDASASDEKYDALASDLRGILVAVKTADCVPILLGDPVKNAFAAVHAGWRGTALSVALKAIQALMSEFGATPSSMIAAIGPAAGPANYEVGPEVLDALMNANPAYEKYFIPTRPDHARIDLPNINKMQLTKAGIPSDRIYIAPYCTMSRSDLFFSYRIDRPKFGRTGRMLAAIGLNA